MRISKVDLMMNKIKEIDIIQTVMNRYLILNPPKKLLKREEGKELLERIRSRLQTKMIKKMIKLIIIIVMMS